MLKMAACAWVGSRAWTLTTARAVGRLQHSIGGTGAAHAPGPEKIGACIGDVVTFRMKCGLVRFMMG